MKNTKKSGFTLIELLVVSTIIIVLATIGFASFAQAGKNARDGKRKADMEVVRQALVLYKQQAADGTYPPTATWSALMTGLVGGNFLSLPTPEDPKSPGAYSYNRGTPTSFCLCAPVETPAKNGNSANQSCSITSPTESTVYYCVTNP